MKAVLAHNVSIRWNPSWREWRLYEGGDVMSFGIIRGKRVTRNRVREIVHATVLK